jgi:hypothetical protein
MTRSFSFIWLDSSLRGHLKRAQVFFMTMVTAQDVAVRGLDDDAKIVESAVTDENGYFEFPYVGANTTVTLRFGMCVHQPT